MKTVENALNESLFPGNRQAYRDLEVFLKKDNLTAFVGAGASVPIFPAWVPLLRELIDLSKDRGLISTDNEVEQYKKIASNDPLEAASIIEDILTKEVFRSLLADRYRTKDTSFTNKHDLINQLGFRGIVTLNYDMGLEAAYAGRFSKMAHSIRSADSAEMLRWEQGAFLPEHELPVLHLHGTTASPKQMIITGSDYNLFYSKPENIHFLDSLWRSNRLVIIGFSFNDPFITHGLDRALRNLESDQRHFALIGHRPSDGLVSIARKTFLRKYRLTPIFFEIRELADGSGDDYSDLEVVLEGLKKNESNIVTSAPESTINPVTINPVVELKSPDDEYKSDFEQNLLVSPSGQVLYVEPKLSDRSKHLNQSDGTPSQLVTVSDVALDSDSYIVTSRGENGLSTLCRRLRLEGYRSGWHVRLHSADDIPNYSRKILSFFGGNAFSENSKSLLIIDDFSPIKHERLLKELLALDLFSKIVIATSAYDSGDLASIIANKSNKKFNIVQLHNLDRADIRLLAANLFETGDTDYVSSIVEKVYNELLQLCIPLTPSNVIMYLRILYKEDEFHPLNRVQIIEKYVTALLKKPSDDYNIILTAKTKIEILSLFVFRMCEIEADHFTELDWHNFCRLYKSETLVDFDQQSFFNELINERIIVCIGSNYYFKYRLFFNYFLGKYVSSRPEVLSSFLKNDTYIRMGGLVEMISGLSTENNILVTDLNEKFEARLAEFRDKYFSDDYDPFRKVKWPAAAGDDKEFWDPIVERVNSGPLEVSKVDLLKRSIEAENRTFDQTVVVYKFDVLERQVILLHSCLIHSLNCSDLLSGSVKSKAIQNVIAGYKVIYQVALLYAPLIARNRLYFWNGIIFSNEINFGEKTTDIEKLSIIILNTVKVISEMATNNMGARKFGETYKYLHKNASNIGINKLFIFSFLLRSKPREWYETALSLIDQVQRDEYYMRAMLFCTIDQFSNEVNTNLEREQLKKIIANIRARRTFNVNKPSSSLVSRTLRNLEKNDFFQDIMQNQNPSDQNG